MVNHKEMTSNGYKWIYDSEGAHFYSKESQRYKWLLMRCLPSDMTNENFDFMAKHGLTNTNKVKVCIK